ncbi:hypothetical protein PoB_003408300 [Plakobranchus ocellatus]|uniref:Uncharacterized protein n=1 Tax=Plakobranchus ocellatus TaxID=259542 RepID=A0AAV4AL95_9GAST|nr:hypothetical protein PoB_003408300 [Plakobranchus ocellatus]
MLTARVPNDVINMVVVVTAAPVLIVLSGVTWAALWHWGVSRKIGRRATFFMDAKKYNDSLGRRNSITKGKAYRNVLQHCHRFHPLDIADQTRSPLI